MGYIYKIINDINEKVYIGKTEQLNPQERWKEHLREYKKDKREKRPLYDAMNKYGIEHFHFEVIEEVADTEEREKYWIDKLRTYVGFEDCNGYNATLGGDGKKYKNYNIETILDLYKQGYNCTEISKIINIDRTYVASLLKSNGIEVLRTIDMYSKKICQIDTITNEVLHIFDSITDAANSLNASRPNIRVAAKSIMQKTSYGYRWLFYDDYLNLKNKEIL